MSFWQVVGISFATALAVEVLLSVCLSVWIECFTGRSINHKDEE